ncbi:MAG: hypothetical protein IPH44_36220 [Myxococcales bacterium]|nr:hypothetical protein [Myxococcales bacterium]MBK7191237.1 hypothetical protein [Myxococcales bacterium]MBP6842611.1 hypothetical protein [Kofleriaceae bacterium]
MRTLLCLTALAAPLATAHADEPGPPAVLALTERTFAGGHEVALRRFDADGAARAVQAGMPLGTYHLAAHAGTGRWVLSFHQLSNGDPLTIGGLAVSKPDDRSTLVFGERDQVVATIYGDPACTSKVKACFESPVRFSPDGAYVFVQSEGSSWATWGRWTFAPKPIRAAIADARTAAALAVDDLGKRAAYQGKGGAVYVTAWPAPAAKARKLVAAKKATVTLPLIMSAAVPVGDHLYWFRRDPADQAVGVYEAWSLTARKVVATQRAAASYPLVRGALVPVPARGSVVFVDDTGFERGTLWELGPAGATALAADVRQALAVSTDGRFVLATRRKDPAAGNAVGNGERLVVIDTVAHAERVIDAGDDAAITAGAFVP